MKGEYKIRILVAYDGSSCAESALADLRRAGLQREGEALVISVAERWLRAPSVVADAARRGSAVGAAQAVQRETDFEIALKNAIEARSRLQSYFERWNIEAIAAAGSPAREILRKAGEWQPDLLVLGCQGTSGVGRYLLGSISMKVLHEAECSVRICRGTLWKNGTPVRIAICVDGSSGAEEAVKAVTSRVWPIFSEARLFTVIDPSAASGRDLREVESEWVRPLLDAAESQLRAVDFNVSSKIDVGDPKQILVADADEWGADCIVLGAAASPYRAALGSVATAVASRAHCSVEVVRSKAPKSAPESKDPSTARLSS